MSRVKSDIDKRYRVNEIFESIQGEGALVGTPALFIRFAGCNLDCKRDGPASFDCDTDHSTAIVMTSDEIFGPYEKTKRRFPLVVFTGGEPMLQLDEQLVARAFRLTQRVAVETNGTLPLCAGPNWVTVSPKTSFGELQVWYADEVKIVRHANDHFAGLPDPDVTGLNASFWYVLPAWPYTKEDVEHCLTLAKQTPPYRLGMQAHKLLGLR